MRRELHEKLAEIAKKEVDAAISSSGLNDSGSDIQRWQVKHVGSGGGYAAVRAASEKEGGGTGRTVPGRLPTILRMATISGPRQEGQDTARASGWPM